MFHLNSKTKANPSRFGIPALLLGAALFLCASPQAKAQELVGGGSLSNPANGNFPVLPITAANPNPKIKFPAATAAQPLLNANGPSYGLGGANMVLVKNWDFGANGNITDYPHMSANFYYHDNGYQLGNGFYGSNSAAPDFQNSINDADQGHAQSVEGMHFYGANSYDLPSVRYFGDDFLRTFLLPTISANGDSNGNVTPSQSYQVASGSFMPKWKLPTGGQLLGQDIVWETKVRYVMTPVGRPNAKNQFWFSLWTNGNSELNNNGAEADLVESYGEDYLDEGAGTPYGPNNFDGHLWHSNMVPSGTDSVNYYGGGWWGGGMANQNVPMPYNATQYHIWTWVYHANDTYEMYVDGIKVQYSKPASGTTPALTYPWTAANGTAIASRIDTIAVGSPVDMVFKFDNAWANSSLYQVDNTEPASDLAPPMPITAENGVFYEYCYSRVYLSQAAAKEQAYTPNNLPPTIPCTIASSDYDTGGEGTGYHINSDANATGTGYRADNNGHVYNIASPNGNNQILAGSTPHEWYNYTVTVPKPANDTASVVTATFEVNCHTQFGGSFHLDDENGNNLTGPITVAVDATQPGPWQTVTSPPFSLNALANAANGASGTHTLRLVVDTAGSGSASVCDFSYMKLDYCASKLANGDFSLPVFLVANNDNANVNPRPVHSGYLYDPTDNGWPTAGWTFSGNAGMTSIYDGLGAAALPVVPANANDPNQHQYAFIQSQLYTGEGGGGTYAGATGGTMGSLSQTLSLAAGTYTIQFNATQDGGNGARSLDEPVQVLLDGGLAVGGKDLGNITPAQNSWGPPGSASGTAGYLYKATQFIVGSGGVPVGVHTITLTATNTTPGLRDYIANVDLGFVSSAPVEAAYNGPHNIPVPGVINAADYDTGGQGVAYNQTVNGGQIGYRTDNSTAVPASGAAVGFTNGGQWYKYTVNVATKGTYNVACSVQSPYGSTFHLADKNGVNLSGPITCNATGSWGALETATATVTLPAGQQVLTWVQDYYGFNLLNMTFTAAATGAPITGTEFDDGAGPWGPNWANAAPNAFDGNVNSFYDCANSTGFVGIDGGTATRVTSIVYAPRPGVGRNMVGGIFEGSNTSATSGYVTLATVPTTPIPTDGLTNTLTVTDPTPYRWLRYRDTIGGYCNVAEIQFIDPPTGVPTIPAGVKAAAGAAGTKKVALTWTASSGATSYHILRSLASGYTGTLALAVNVTSPSYTDSGLTAGTTYYYEITAVNAKGGSKASAQASAKAQ